MTFIPAYNCAKVVIEYSLGGQVCLNTFWFEYSANPTQSDLDDLAEYMYTNLWLDNWQTSLPSSAALLRITATRQNTENDIQGVYIPTEDVTGTGSGSPVPNNVAIVTSLRTHLRGRSYRGRTYFGGFLNSFVATPNTVTSGFASGLVSMLVVAFLTNLPAGWTWVVASHFANKAPRVSAVLTPIISVVVDTILDSQRRRLTGRGR